MADYYIKREPLLDSMDRAMRELSTEGITDPEDYLDAAEIAMRECVYNEPTVDVAPAIHAQWEYNPGDNVPYCNNCAFPQDMPTNYCHNCGAKMDGKANG